MAEVSAPKVSIVVPIYNVGPYLARCLDSLLAQTLAEIEIICADDGSTDDGPRILAGYAARDARVRTFQQANRGVSAARNAGLGLVAAPYVGFVDPDDWIAPETYRAALDRLEAEDDIDLVSWAVELVSNPEITGGPDKRDALRDRLERLHGKYPAAGPDKCHLLGSACCKLFKTDLIRRYGVDFPEAVPFAEDQAFIWKYLAHARYGWQMPDRFYKYFLRGAGSAHAALCEGRFARAEVLLAAFRDIFEFYKKHGLAEQEGPALALAFEDIFLAGARYTLDREAFRRQARDLAWEYDLPARRRDLIGRLKRGRKIKQLDPGHRDRPKYTFWEKIFSFKNEEPYKVMRLLGLKIRLPRAAFRKIYSREDTFQQTVYRVFGHAFSIKVKRGRPRPPGRPPRD